MSRTMVRWVFVGAAALAVLGAVGAVMPGAATAEAAPSASTFAGSYSGYVPGSSGTYSLTISSAGKVTGSGSGFSGAFGFGYDWTGQSSGSVRNDGRLSISGLETRESTSTEPHLEDTYKVRFHGKAVMTRSLDGSLTGVSDDLTTFVWTPLQ